MCKMQATVHLISARALSASAPHRITPSMGKFLLFVFAVIAFLGPVRAGFCAAGTLLTSYNITAGTVLSDPTRGRVYASVPATNSVAVIDTATLVLTSIPVGSSPQGMALSLDSSLLFVANNGSTAAAITVIDLNTLTTKASMSAPSAVSSVAVGANNVLYATGGSGILQFDIASETYQGTSQTSAVWYDGYLTATPDGKTLFYGTSGLSPQSLVSFDVSSGTPVLLQKGGFSEGGDSCLTVSHNGKYVTFDSSYNIVELSATNINTTIGTFDVGAYPDAVVFSPDDTLVYAANGPYGSIQVYDSQTFAEVASYPFAQYVEWPSALAVDKSGAEVFLAQGWPADQPTIEVYSTGTPLPVGVVIPATVVKGSQTSGTVSMFNPASTPTVVSLTSSMPAQLNVPATVTIPAGSTSMPFTVSAPQDTLKDGTQVVTLTATATGMGSSSETISVLDNNVDHFAIFPIGSPQYAGQQFRTSVSAVDVNGVTIPSYSGTITLTGSGASGVVPISPSSVGPLSTGTWTGYVSANAVGNNVVLTVNDGAGHAGSSNQFNVLANLPAMIVTPATDASASGPQGGPLSPNGSYTITNSGTGILNWNVSNTQPWLTLSPTTGTLITGASVTIAAEINAEADLLQTGSYSSVISFTNSTNGTGNVTRDMNLSVVPQNPILSVSPASGLTASGTFGGPFAPSSITYTLSNTGNVPLNWAATNTQQWLTLSANSGTIASGTSTTLTATVNTIANELFPGSYSDTISFTNTQNGSGNVTQPVFLSVAFPAMPVVSGSSTATGYEGYPFTYSITASDNPTSFNATGLPAGVTVNTATGLLSGTPASSGTFYATTYATNPSGTASASLVITVLSTPPPSSAFYYCANGYVGGDGSNLYNAANGGTVTASVNYDNGVSLSVGGWEIDFAAPSNAALTTGTYLGAARFPFQSGTQPGLSFDGQGRGDNTLSGSFTVLEIEYGAGNTIVSFAADFIQYDECDISSWNIGSIRYNTTVPLTTPPPPSITSVNASNITSSGAVLSGQVNPNGLATTVYFQYGTDTTYGTGTTQEQSLSAGLSPLAVTAALTGLQASTTYHYRLVAISASGTSTSPDATFVTPNPFAPQITSTSSASGVLNTAFTYQITTNNNSATSYGATGLPSGLIVNTATGLISGTPTATGTFASTISASNTSGTGCSPLVITILATTPPVTAFYYYGAGYVSEDSSGLYNSANGDTIGASVNYDGGVSLSINGTNDWWDLDFAAPASAPLTTGTYLGAARFPFQSSSQPGLSFDGDGCGDNTLTGYFTVLDIVYNGSTVVSFAADFVQYDEGSLTSWNVGSIRYNSTVPLTLPPPPTVTAETPTAISSDGAVLNETVNQNGPPATVYFQYGTNAAYGSVTGTQSFGSGTSNMLVSATLSGLQPGTTYHYRVVAATNTGVTYGSDQTFTTTGQEMATLTVNATPTNGGKVTGSGTYKPGSQQAISATPNSGWTFVGWNDGNTQANRTVTLPSGGAAYTAYFQAVSQPKQTAITVTTSGGGSVLIASRGTTTRVRSNITSTCNVTLGSAVTITAQPAANMVFAGWTDSYGDPLTGINGNAAGRTITFSAIEGSIDLVATFVANPFASISGVYGGTFNNGAGDPFAGGFTLSCSKTGGFTGTLLFHGKSYPFSGAFIPSTDLSTASAAVTINTKRTDDYGQIVLSFDFPIDPDSAASGLISGIINNGANANNPASTNLIGNRNVFTKASSTYDEGYYTMIGTNTDDSGNVLTMSVGTLTIANAGNVVFEGTLYDWSGTVPGMVPFTATGSISSDHIFHFYAPLPYTKKTGVAGAAISGDLTVENFPGTSDIDGLVNYAADVSGTNSSVAWQVSFIGSAYTAPKSRARVLDALDGDDGQATLDIQSTSGNFSTSITDSATVSTANKVSLVTAEGTVDKATTATFTARTGLFTGSFQSPISQKKVSFSGVVFPSQEMVFGFYVDSVTGDAGTVTLTPQ